MHFMKYKWIFFGISLVALVPGLISLAIFKLRPSIDFTGGTLLEIQVPQAVKEIPAGDFVAAGKQEGIEISSVQPSSDNTYVLRSKTIDRDQNEKLKARLATQHGDIVEKRFETVGPTVGVELTKKALWAVAVASLAIVIYIAWSFRKVPRPYSSWKFGVSAVLALIHDALVVLGLFSILGHFYHVEIDSLFVTAVLTVIGFSVHDTIVVFDRVRENLPKMAKESFEEVVDFSIGETLVRSLNTSFTVALTLTSLLLFGGETIRWFVVALLVGIVSGTYSSIFNAAPLLVLWESRKRK